MTTFRTDSSGRMSTVDHPTPEDLYQHARYDADALRLARASLRSVLHGGGWFDDPQAAPVVVSGLALPPLKLNERDAECAAFERWIDSERPSGSVESVQHQWMTSAAYADFLDSLEWPNHD